ncbi:cytochrome P450 family protein [Heterostelium album PN500]|uniref:Cytochrome P450 family protein n=1 Tax=Heterostelium pallidum (strain ATCC 26659 / Pp 5 / PN500) TaxID=670386 RepID=D3B1H8_HETP5|nr:cytochrome P450 family protein [Heterostelium album PN500]EFA85152.1 cytochrome P450 family protein [Heterostelium album PN500]|eukprot:XP_020437261.1 cytochrome P450 family protein [Heterostelium album PN500]
MYIIILVIVFIYILENFISKNIKKSKCEPPGGIALPLIGNLHQVGDIPHIGLVNLSKKYGDVFRIYMGDLYTVVVSDPKIIREFAVNHFENFTNRPTTPTFNLLSRNFQNLVVARDERWFHIRKLVANSFTKTKLRPIGSILDRQVGSLLDKMKEYQLSGQPFYPRDYCKKYSLNIIFNLMFSDEIPLNEDTNQGKIAKLIPPIEGCFKRLASAKIQDFINVIAPFYFLYSKITGTEMDQLYDFTKDIYDEHLATLDPENPRDLIDALIIDSSDKQEENKESVILTAIDFILAGTDTSASTIEMFMMFMINNQEVQTKAAAELESVVGRGQRVSLQHRSSTPYMVAVIKEVMRIKPIAPLGLPREAKEACMVGDYYIPKGAQIVFNFTSLHTSEKYWDHPQEFMPERFLMVSDHTETFLPFSVGKRNCVGMNLAMDELYIACANIIHNFVLQSSTKERLDEEEVFGLTIHPKLFSIDIQPRY